MTIVFFCFHDTVNRHSKDGILFGVSGKSCYSNALKYKSKIKNITRQYNKKAIMNE